MTRLSVIVTLALTVTLLGCEGQVSSDVHAEATARLGEPTLRLVAANLTSGAQQSYSPGEGLRILKGLHPDVAMLQEFNYLTNKPADFRALVDQTFGPEFSYARGAPTQIPNGIISRYPIIQSGDWTDPQVTNRAFTWARVDVPGPHDLWAVSLHLLTKSAGVRDLEAQTLVALLTQNVPAGDWVVLAGDLNTGARNEPALTTLSSAVVTTGPWPTDASGDGDTNSTRSKPYDWVLVNPDLSARAVPTILGQSTFPSGLVVDTRTYPNLTDLAPALATDSAATAMQHMAVVRDFSLADSSGPHRDPPTVHLESPNGGEQFVAGDSITVHWTSTSVATVDLEYAADGVHFSPIASEVNAETGAIGWTVPAQAGTTALVRVHSSVDPTVVDASDAPFTVLLPAHVIINEILANEPGSATGAEFVELFNTGGVAADLSGATLSDATAIRHVFPAGTTLAPGGTLVVFASAAFIPVGLGNASGATTGSLNLTNSGDTVTLALGGTVLDSVQYDSKLASVDGVSMNRSPDHAQAPFALHTQVNSTLRSSPGTSAAGTP